MRLIKPSGGPGNSPARRRAITPADRLPKSVWRYIALSCGHYTTPEEQEFYGVWRPRRGRYWCSYGCERWVGQQRPPSPPPSPDEPMF